MVCGGLCCNTSDGIDFGENIREVSRCCYPLPHTGQRIDTVDLDRLEGVRRGFSLGGRLMTTNYDPLRSLAVTVKKSKRELTSYNLKANSAWSCQM